MLPTRKRNERLVALVIFGALALNYPLLFLFGGTALLFGIPVSYLYLFLAWGGFIALVALIIEGQPHRQTSAEDGAADREH